MWTGLCELARTRMNLSRFVTSTRQLKQVFKTKRLFQQITAKAMSDDGQKNVNIQFESFAKRLDQISARTAIKTEFQPPNYVSALVPTVHSDSFDTQGRKIHPWVIPKVFDHLDASWPQYRVVPESGSQENGIYILKLQIDINPELYSLTCPMHPLLLEGRMLFLKRSSRSFQNTLRHPELDKPYAIMTALDVNVNLKTRRPTPYPDIWRHESIPSEGSVLEFDVPAKPSNTVKVQRQVYQSDIDENGHVNYTSYIKFCHDAFVDNVNDGKYSQNAADHLEAGVKQMQVVFKNESLRGDILDIECWEDNMDGGSYCFELRKGEDLVVALILRFFSSSVQQKSKI